jgi:hypothetical protein
MVIVHGVSDPVFSIKDTMNWWTDVNRLNNGHADEFVRLFAVPGMNHCGGGPATDQFDAFSALVNWVEKSSAPDRIVGHCGERLALARPDPPALSPSRSKPGIGDRGVLRMRRISRVWGSREILKLQIPAAQVRESRSEIAAASAA